MSTIRQIGDAGTVDKGASLWAVRVCETHHTDPGAVVNFAVFLHGQTVLLFPVSTKHGAEWRASGGPPLQGPLRWATVPPTKVLVELDVTP